MTNPKEEELKARIDAEMDHLYELALKVQIMDALVTDMESQPAFSDYQLKEHLYGSDNAQG